MTIASQASDKRDDFSMIRGIVEGDESAAREFYHSHCDAVFRFVRRRCGESIEDAEEITNDIFLSALDMAPTFEGKSSAITWLCSLARNRIIDHRRSTKAAKRIPEEQLVRIDDESRRLLRDVHNSKVSVEELVEQLDRVRVVQSLFNTMTPDQREAISMCYIEGFSVPEIAKIMNRSTAAVERLLERAKERPRREMLKWLGEDSFRMMCFNLLNL